MLFKDQRTRPFYRPPAPFSPFFSGEVTGSSGANNRLPLPHAIKKSGDKKIRPTLSSLIKKIDTGHAEEAADMTITIILDPNTRKEEKASLKAHIKLLYQDKKRHTEGARFAIGVTKKIENLSTLVESGKEKIKKTEAEHILGLTDLCLTAFEKDAGADQDPSLPHEEKDLLRNRLLKATDMFITAWEKKNPGSTLIVPERLRTALNLYRNTLTKEEGKGSKAQRKHETGLNNGSKQVQVIQANIVRSNKEADKKGPEKEGEKPTDPDDEEQKKAGILSRDPDSNLFTTGPGQKKEITLEAQIMLPLRDFMPDKTIILGQRTHGSSVLSLLDLPEFIKASFQDQEKEPAPEIRAEKDARTEHTTGAKEAPQKKDHRYSRQELVEHTQHLLEEMVENPDSIVLRTDGPGPRLVVNTGLLTEQLGQIDAHMLEEYMKIFAAVAGTEMPAAKSEHAGGFRSVTDQLIKALTPTGQEERQGDTDQQVILALVIVVIAQIIPHALVERKKREDKSRETDREIKTDGEPPSGTKPDNNYTKLTPPTLNNLV